MFEGRRLKAREIRRPLTKREQEVRQFTGLLEPAAIEIIVPAEGERPPLTDIAMELKFLKGKSLDVRDELLFLVLW